MTNPQTWTLLGALIALIGGMMVMVFHYMGARMETLEARIGARFDGVENRLERVETELVRVDRDIQGISNRVFRRDSD
jgi:hypothetical protein